MSRLCLDSYCRYRILTNFDKLYKFQFTVFETTSYQFSIYVARRFFWHIQVLSRLTLNGHIKKHNNGPLYSITVIGTLAIDG